MKECAICTLEKVDTIGILKIDLRKPNIFIQFVSKVKWNQVYFKFCLERITEAFVTVTEISKTVSEN